MIPKTSQGFELLVIEPDLSLIVLQKEDLQYYFKQVTFYVRDGKLNTDFTMNIASKDDISDVEYIQAAEKAPGILKHFLEEYAIGPFTKEKRPTTIVMPSQRDIDRVERSKLKSYTSTSGKFTKVESTKKPSNKFQKI